MLSAICFDSDQTKLLLSGNGLIHYQTANFGQIQINPLPDDKISFPQLYVL